MARLASTLRILSTFGVFALPLAAQVEEPLAAAIEATIEDLYEDRALGDLFGLRREMASFGLALEPSLIFEAALPVDGGRSQAASARLFFDFAATLDLEAAAGLEGGTLFANAFLYLGRPVSETVGDFGVLSNIDLDGDTFGLLELWYEQRWLEDRLRVKLGKIDANSEFMAIDAAGGFLHSYGGFGGAVSFLPTYPDSSLGLVLTGRPVEPIELAFGLFDADEGAPQAGNQTLHLDGDAATLFGELRWNWAEETAPGRLALGFSHHTGRVEEFRGTTDDGATDLWVTAEQRLLRFDDEEPGRALHFFGQVAFADEDRAEAHWTLFTGFVARGPFDARPHDEIGLAYGQSELSREAGFTADERFVELYYRAELTPWSVLTADAQLITDPGGDNANPDAWIAMLRLEIAL